MYGITNSVNIIQSGGGGDKVFAVNNTGADITAGQKIWLNKHNVFPVAQTTFTSGAFSSYMNGKYIFMDVNNNFIAFGGSNEYHKWNFNTPDRSWTGTTVEIPGAPTGFYTTFFNYNDKDNKYYGQNISTNGYSSSTSYVTESIVYNNDETFTYYEDSVRFNDRVSFRTTSTSYKFEVVDNNDDSIIDTLDFTATKEKVCTVFCAQKDDTTYRIRIITKSNTAPKPIREYLFDYTYTMARWDRYAPLDNGGISTAIVQPVMKYYTGLENGDYFFTNAKIYPQDKARLYNLEAYKIVDNKFVKAEDLPADLSKYSTIPCSIYYDGKLKRLYVTTQTTYEIFNFTNGAFVLDTKIVFDESQLIQLYAQGYSFSVSADRTVLVFQGNTTASSGKYFMVKVPNPDNLDWHAENFQQCTSLTLTGYATGNTDSEGRYEVSTVLGVS